MKKKPPFVSIITVNYNGRKYLKSCFDSLFRLNYPRSRFEIIMVDNCSIDESLAFVRKKYPKAKIIRNDVNNYCKANNRGIKKARGEYVALLNNDVKVDKNWLIELVNVIQKDKNIAAVGSKILTADGKYIQNAGHYELPNFYWGERGAGREKKLYDNIEEVPSLCGASVLYRKSYIEQVGLFDEDFIIYGEDVDISYRLKKIGYKLLFVPKSKVKHIFHGSGSEDLARYHIERNRLLFLAKHFPWQLSTSLFGKGTFTVDSGLENCGKLYDILPDVLFTLCKNHSIDRVNQIITSLFQELRKLVYYENDKLIEEIKNKHMTLREREMELKSLKDLQAKFNQIEIRLDSAVKEISSRNNLISEKDQCITNLKEELTNLLKQKMDEVLLKDGQLIEKDQHITNLNDELTNLSNQLKQRMDEILIKDGQLIEKDEEFNNLSNQLKNRVDEVLIKNTQLFQNEQILNSLQQQLSSKNSLLSKKDQELTNLSNQLKQRMDEILINDGQLIEKNLEVTNLKESLVNHKDILSKKESLFLEQNITLNNLKEELVHKNNMICDKEKKLNETKIKLEQRIKELNGIYNSEGFRFILRPLWTILWNLKIGFKKFKTVLSTIFLVVMTILLTPLFFFASFSFFLESLTWKFLKFFLNKKIPERKILPFDNLKVSVVIPSWNGISLLKECLNSIFVLAEFKDGEKEVLVVDDGSADGTYEFVRQNYPNVRIIHNEKKMGFGYTCNRGVREAKNELIVLINNDILLTENFLKPIKEHFKDEGVFAVTPKLYGWDKKTFQWGMHMGHFKNGYISLWNEADTPDGERIYNSSPTIFAIGGAMVFRKGDFLWLGGFDEIYRPNCWEDIDISYRAWKRGLRVIYEPESLIYHKGKATLTYERHKEIKNEISFTWKNITDWDILKEHLNLLPLNLQKQGYSFLKGFLWALNLLPMTLSHRFKERRYIKFRDNNILNYCMNYYENFKKNHLKHFEKGNKPNILIISMFIPYPLNRGGNIRICTLAKLLRDRYNVYLLSLVNKPYEFDYIPKLKEIFKDVSTVYIDKSTFPNLLFPDNYKFAYTKELIEKFKELQNIIPLDIIQIESNELLYLLDFVKFTPVVYTEHDISILSFTKSYYRRESSNNMVNFYEYLKRVNFHKNAYKKLQNVITLSIQDDRLARKIFPSVNFSLIRTGVDVTIFSFEQKKQYNKIKKLIFVGHYKHYPNENAIVYFVKDIFPLIRNKLKDVELLIVGSDPTERVKSLLQYQGVKVSGTIDDVRPYLKEADIFINPIRISTGIKGKVLEAMACGIPVVSTQNGTSGIDAIHGKEILIANTPKDFADYVIRLIEDEDLYLRLVQNARKLVESKYNWHNIVKELDNLYTNIISNHVESNFSKKVYLDKVSDEVEKTVMRYIDEVELDGPEVGPQELHIELTYNCDSKCIMCDLWDYNKRISYSRKELTIEEIESFIKNSSYLKGVKNIALSGGEPFLRKDLVGICEVIIKNLPDVSISILTNGLNTDLIVGKTKEILKKCSFKSILLGSSLDGIEEIHDKVRGRKEAFHSLSATINRCKLELPNVDFTLTFTLTPYNFKYLIPAKKFADEHNLKFYVQFAVPKEARRKFKWTESYFKKIESDIHDILYEWIKLKDAEKILNDIKEECFDKDFLANFYYWSNLVRYQKEPKRLFKKCIAGSRFAMLSPFGDASLCPVLKERTIGNIRKENFDNIWMSNEARIVRDFIKEGACHCWLACIVPPLLDEVFIKKKQLTYLIEDKRINDIKTWQENININEKEFSQKKIILDSTPPIIGIGAHYSCNAKCIFCLDGDYPFFNIDIYKKFFEKKLGNVLPLARALNLCGYGEILLIPEILVFLDYLNKTLPYVNKIITTNGIPLGSSIFEKFIQTEYTIQISLHSSNKKLYELLTGINAFEKIIEQIKKILSIRPDKVTPAISLVFVINSLNVEDLPNFVKFAIDLGVDEVICNYMAVYKPSHFELSCFYKQDITNEKIIETEEIARRNNFRLKVPPKFNQVSKSNGDYVCSEPWKYFYVETQGSVLPCCYADKHIGYLNQKNFEEIWNGKAYQELRKSQIEKDANGFCKYCYKLNENNVNDIFSHVNIVSLSRHGIIKEDIEKMEHLDDLTKLKQ